MTTSLAKQRTHWAAAILIALQLTACSGGPPENAAKGSERAAPNACAAVTAADIEQVFGVPVQVQAGDALKTIATTSLCNYVRAQDSRGVVSVLIRFGPPGLDAESNLKQYIDGLKMNMGDAYRVDPVEGLSGPAVWNPDMKQLTVFKGSALTILTMSDTGGKDPLEAARALAEKALDRM
jgi:hypothetical protein